MDDLRLNPATAAGSVDRAVRVPLLPLFDDAIGAQSRFARASRRRLGSMRVRPFDAGLRPFRVY